MNEYRKNLEENRAKIMKVLDITEDSYLESFFENGCRFSEQYATIENFKDVEFEKQLKQSAKFWNWYEKRHNAIDRSFLELTKHSASMSRHQLLNFYKLTQKGSKIFPPDTLLTEINKEYEAR